MSTTSSVPLESKSAKKRKTKTEQSATHPLNGAADLSTNGTGVAEESAYVKEMAKQIRNLHKKIQAVGKTEAVVKENPSVSLDDLVAQKKINADQKAQILKKPQLEAQMAQLEEQHKHYIQLTQDLEARFDKEKASLIEAHQADVKKAKDEAASHLQKEQSVSIKNALQIISQFLNTAAAKRQDGESDSEESRAYEGALFHLYQGNSIALETMQKLVEGSDDSVRDSAGVELSYSFSQLKLSATKESVSEELEVTEPTEGSITEDIPISTDPTVANAGLTELEDTRLTELGDNTTIAVPTATDQSEDVEPQLAAPEQTSTGAEAANAVAESSWDPQASIITENTETGEGWVQVPRDPAETETGAAAPAAQQSTSNWADEAGAAAEEKPTTPIPENDGFSEVRRDRGGRGRGGSRGGRGFDGRGRGRGRGEFRGRGGRGRGGPRGASSNATPAS